jgi:hypothetical protein
MPKPSRKARLTDAKSEGFATVEEATADEAEILRDIDEATGDADAVAPSKDLEGGAARPKK